MSRRRILYLQYTNPAVYPSLNHSARRLAERGWSVLFLGIQAIGTEGVSPEPHPRIVSHLWPAGGRGWHLKFHYLMFTAWALVWSWRWRPDWIYVSDPEACPMALLLRWFSPGRMIYHEHDSPGRRPARRWMVFVRRCRGWIGKRAELCVLPNEERASVFKDELDRREDVFAVWNCPPLAEIAPERGEPPERRLRLLYQGSFVPARMPFTVLEALAQLPAAVKLTVIGYETVGAPGYLAAYRRRADELKLGDRVTLRKGLLRSDLVNLGRQCDVGLAFQPGGHDDINMQFMVGASNKFYEYLGNGLALLVSENPEWKKAFVDSGYGRSCEPGQTDSLIEALQWFWAHPEESRAMGARGREKVRTDWNYERQFQPVLEKLEGAA